ncbi:GGDEF domain protein [hydrothermal vent metagenome]|uniref:GGDEF domain protein n=1 Tax=hydrothermal vent metagenome TaxID=652676 RepID=A0A1W1E888_9ZZZZ
MSHGYIGCIVLFILLAIAFWIYRKKSFDRHLRQFIDLSSDIVVLTDRTKILAMNQTGLNLFQAQTLQELPYKTRYLSKLFKEIDSEERYVDSIDWVTRIKRNQHIKVTIQFQHLVQTMQMQVNKINEERYLVTFHNISKVVAEKEAVAEDAERDELTRIYNRKKFNSTLAYAIRNAEIYGTNFSIILFDIDHFKQINDTHGHDVGDKILIQLSALVKNLLKEGDILARWGGEEFVILSSATKLNDAYELADRLRREIAHFPFPFIKTLTCSFGVTQYEKEDTKESIVKRADNALYVSKENGRNRVSIASV